MTDHLRRVFHAAADRLAAPPPGSLLWTVAGRRCHTRPGALVITGGGHSEYVHKLPAGLDARDIR
jgi:hypothetical protein